jgi:hypothetical protein
LLSAAGLGVQLLQTYDLGLGVDGNVVTPDRIPAFVFDILSERIAIRTVDVRFSLRQIADKLAAETRLTQ